MPDPIEVADTAGAVESPEDFAERLLDVTQALCWEPRHLTDLIRSRDAAVRREARKAMFAALIRQCRNSVTSAVSEEWLSALAESEEP